MRKVAIIVNSLGFGGNERSAVNIAKSIANYFNVIIITQEDKGNPYSYEGEVICLNTPSSNSLIKKIFYNVIRLFKVKKIVKNQSIDLLFTILPIYNVLNYVKYKCKKIVSCRDFNDLKKHTHNYYIMAKKSDYIVCNSKYMSCFLVEKYKELKNKTIYIYNSIDITTIESLCKEKLDIRYRNVFNNNKIIVSAGRLSEVKGFNNLIKAFYLLCKKINNVKLVLIGSGENKLKIVELVNKLGIDNNFIIIDAQTNLYKFFARSDVFVLSSYSEGFPNVLLEAMACKLPVISTNCASGPSEALCAIGNESINDAKYGILISNFTNDDYNWEPDYINKTHFDLCEELFQILSDNEKKEKLKSSAYTRAKDFELSIIGEKWIELFSGILN